MRSKYWNPCAIVMPATAAYGELNTKIGSGKSSANPYMTQNLGGRSDRRRRVKASAPPARPSTRSAVAEKAAYSASGG